MSRNNSLAENVKQNDLDIGVALEIEQQNNDQLPKEPINVRISKIDDEINLDALSSKDLTIDWDRDKLKSDIEVNLNKESLNVRKNSDGNKEQTPQSMISKKMESGASEE